MTDGHLTDEQLSSHLDGRSDAPVGGHLGGCAECRARLAALGAVRDLVRTPVPPVEREVRARSIATVLRAAQDPRSAAGTSPVPMRPRHRPQVWVGAAAAVLVLAAAVGVPLALSGTGTSVGSAASAPASPHKGATQHRSSSSSGTFGSSDNVATSTPDLGAVGSIGALRASVEAREPLAFAPVPTGAAASAATPSTTPVAGAPTTTAPAPLATTATTNATSATPSATGVFESCASSATDAAGPGRTLQLLATATFEGTPALVYVFSAVPGAAASTHAARPVAVVTARHGCRKLGSTPV